MAHAADRMRAMRERRRARGLRELRLVVPDARSKTVRRRVAKAVARLDRNSELAALGWIEAVCEFDAQLDGAMSSRSLQRATTVSRDPRLSFRRMLCPLS